MFQPERILQEYVVTEKATARTSELNQYTFKVARTANRDEVAAAVERVFKVKVERVNILNTTAKRKPSRVRRGEFRVRPGYKKAIVKLAAGDKIELLG